MLFGGDAESAAQRVSATRSRGGWGAPLGFDSGCRTSLTIVRQRMGAHSDDGAWAFLRACALPRGDYPHAPGCPLQACSPQGGVVRGGVSDLVRRSLGRPPDVATIVVTRVVVYIPRSADGPPVGPARTAQGKSWWGTADGVPHLPRPAQWQGGLSVPPLGARAASRFPFSRGGWAG